MESGRKRVTLDLDGGLKRRLKEAAAQKGVSMREYCEKAIEKELAEDEAESLPDDWSDLPNAQYFALVRKAYFGDRTLPGNSVDLIREAREIRDAQLDATTKHRP